MTAKILDGKALAEDIRAEVAASVTEIQLNHGVTPGLAAVLVGDDPASAVYVRNKRRACDEVGIVSDTILLAADSTTEKVLETVADLNKDPRFHGILIQLPLPPQIDELAIIESIDPDKDVDGLHPFNVGKLVQGRADFVPGTPAGIQQILMRNGHDPAGANVVICGRSDIVGKPMALLLMQRGDGANATVTVCHTRTKNMTEITRHADILVTAIGRPNAITADMVKEGAIVIDVGINRVDDASRKSGYRLDGDVDFAEVSKKASSITPVPGGVGPMTIAMLLVNTLTATRISIHGRGS
ncbi:MAG: bifunctional methylenetetrahydrofolate dehydrogenase/methenyltetrahydrofolate cyclohydrolase FolD [Chloroflexota bacterium]|nr:bifunctional methylenetetrahydrofolate dehydrogenase/methenyltetrahydrofolate cyclohydrolase FolD [Chloroflexota bacterium]